MTKLKISIIIPTVSYTSRKEQISRTLVALKNQSISVPFEVIIIDNDQNQRNYLHDDLPVFAKIVCEPNAGLSYARNRGVRTAIGDIVAFLDDDVVPAKTWINALICTHELPDALCVGGPIILEDRDKIRIPRWFSDYFFRFIIPPKFPKLTGIIRKPFYLIGANMSFKQTVFKNYGFFDTNLGRRGNCLLSGEDVEFMLRIPPKNIFYEPRAVVLTKITSLRLTRRYFVRRIFWQAISDARIIVKHGSSLYYDQQELFLSAGFGKAFLKIFRRGLLFQTFCMAVRIGTFTLASFLRL